MKSFVTLLLELAASFIKSIFGKNNSLPHIQCQFCGELGHDVDDCPNASKYKLFNVDRD
jgi:hypothetical protein